MPAYTLPAAADYTEVLRRVVKFLGVADPNDPEGSTVVSTSPYTSEMISKQIIQSDYEVMSLIVGVLDHPYRNTYMTSDAVEIAHGGQVPAHIGNHGAVEVARKYTGSLTTTINIASVEVGDQIFSSRMPGRRILVKNGATTVMDARIMTMTSKTTVTTSQGAGSTQTTGSVWVFQNGRLANSVDHVTRARENYELYGEPDDLYYIDNGVVLLADKLTVLLMYLPTLVAAAGAPPTLKSPKAYQNAIIGHAIATLFPINADASHRANWAGIWAAYAEMIQGGKASLPDPEHMQRIAN